MSRQGVERWQAKRADPVLEGPRRRSGAIQPIGGLLDLVRRAVGEYETEQFIFVSSWPLKGRDYVEDAQIAEKVEQEGLLQYYHDPARSRLPLLYFMIHSAMNGCVFRLRTHGTHNDTVSLTIKGSLCYPMYREF